MLICAVESSAKAVSAAVIEDGIVIGENFINTNQTHSETLMPMLDNLLKTTGTAVKDIALFAVSKGPGSFTGIRIGISCIKGLAFPYDTPCLGVSTLEAIAQPICSLEGKTICAVMDARRNQVYNAVFKAEAGKLHRLCDDRTISIEELHGEYKQLGNSLVLIGDGAELCYKTFKESGAVLADETIRVQRASSVGLLAEKIFEKSGGVTPAELLPFYLRPSQAERERKEMEDKI